MQGNESQIGVVPQIDFSGAASADDVIDLLLAAIPNPDVGPLDSSGAIQGIISYLDSMSPTAATHLRAELEGARVALNAL